MEKQLQNFVIVFMAVVTALFAYDQIRKPTAPKPMVTAGNDAVKEDLQRAMGNAKVAVSEYYASRGQWPPDNAATGLAPPDSYRGNSLRRLEVSGNTITLTFDARSGVDGGRVVLTGDASNPTMGPSWTCTSPNLDYIAAVAPNCTYAAAP